MLENKINENFDFLKKVIQDYLFAKRFVGNNNEIIVTLPEDAEIYATDQDVDINKRCEYQYWTAILEDEARTGEIVDYLNSINSYDSLYLIDSKYNELLEDHLKVEYEKAHSNMALYDVLCGEIYNVFINRIIFSDQSSLHKRMMDSFMRGGMICGWKGAYPKGEILIYPLTPSAK